MRHRIDGGPDRAPVVIERRSLSRQVTDAIRGDILYGRLREGEHLSQRELCERYGTSRMPVRDALRQLVHEGFVVTVGSRAVVASLEPDDLADWSEISGVLHGLAARRNARLADPKVIKELRELQTSMMEAAEKGDLVRMSELNRAFHRHINVSANSSKLIALLSTVRVPHHDFLVQFPDWATRSLQEHSELIEAIAAGNEDDAERLAREQAAAFGEELRASRPDA